MADSINEVAEDGMQIAAARLEPAAATLVQG
jgi:hypothetical protein